MVELPLDYVGGIYVNAIDDAPDPVNPTALTFEYIFLAIGVALLLYLIMHKLYRIAFKGTHVRPAD